MMKGETQGAADTQSVSVEGSGDEEGALGRGEEEMDVEEGGVFLDEKESRGVQIPSNDVSGGL